MCYVQSTILLLQHISNAMFALDIELITAPLFINYMQKCSQPFTFCTFFGCRSYFKIIKLSFVHINLHLIAYNDPANSWWHNLMYTTITDCYHVSVFWCLNNRLAWMSEWPVTFYPMCEWVCVAHVPVKSWTAPLLHASYSPYPGRRWAQPECFSLRCLGYRVTDGPPVLPPVFGPFLSAQLLPALHSHTPPHQSPGSGCPHPVQAGRKKQKELNYYN